MGKGFVFVVIYTVILMTLFCVFSYLMSTVNPAPITKSNGKLLLETMPNGTYLREFYYPLIKEEILRYGIERADNEETRRRLDSTKSTYFFRVTRKNSKQLNQMYSTQPGYIRDTTDSTIDHEVFVPLYKKGKRRSVNGNTDTKLESNSGMVILKIVDDIGNTKIEIKVEPDAFNENYAKDLRYANPGEKTQIMKREYKNRDTIIKILPNNSLSLDKLDQSSLLIDFANKDTIISKSDEKRPMAIRNVSTTQSLILKALHTDKLLLYSATNSTEKVLVNKSHLRGDIVTSAV